MNEYLTAIRTLAVDCNFGETLVERLLEQFVNGCADKRIQQELLGMDDLTTGRVFAIMRAHDYGGRRGTWGISRPLLSATSQRNLNAGNPNTWQRRPRKRRSPT